MASFDVGRTVAIMEEVLDLVIRAIKDALTRPMIMAMGKKINIFLTLSISLRLFYFEYLICFNIFKYLHFS